MKRVVTLLMGIVLALTFSAGTASAALSQVPKALSSVADGKSTITVTVTDTSGAYYINNVWKCQSWGVVLTGSGNIFNGHTYSGDPSTSTVTMKYVGSGTTCTGTYTLASTKAETKTATLAGPGIGGWQTGSNPPMTLVFKTPPLTKKTTATSSAPKPAFTASAVPKAPEVASVMVAGRQQDVSKSFTVDQNKSLLLSGKTVPNGIVTLVIHSTPRTATTTADKDGAWSYTVKGLEPGSHTVQASVKDPATGQESPKAQILAFSVKAAAKPAATAPAVAVQKSASKTPLIVVLALVILAAGAGFYFWKRKHQAKVAPAQEAEVTEPKA